MKKIKLGIFGTGARGRTIVIPFLLLGCEVVAICETRAAELKKAKEKFPDAAAFSDFDAFIEQDMDAVILANFFHEHAPYAIRCLERGIHVFSECISNGTMAEGVELIRAFEKSNCVYMLAENYPNMLFNREMKKLCDGGTLGKIIYAEGEYNHPVDPCDPKFMKNYVYVENHWRNSLPRTYYLTHSLGPIMHATGATPKRVTAFSCFIPLDESMPSADQNGDRAAIILTQNDDGSVFRFGGWSEFGAHASSYRLCGTKGQVENLRGMGNQVLLRYNEWEIPEGKEEVNLYTPEWNDPDEEFIKQSGHGGGDYVTARMFVDCIRNGTQPEHPFDIYSAVAMASVAILGHRSVLSGGMPYDIPDFRNEEERKKYENDYASPCYSEGKEPTVPCCSHTDYKPTKEQIALYHEYLKK